jgi:hypothetical protein
MLARLSYALCVFLCLGWIAFVLVIGYFWPGTILLGPVQ